MRLFWEIGRRSFQRQITYRTAALAGLATNFFFGLLRAYVLIALYAARTSVEGLPLAGAITYTGLTQAMIMFFGLFGSPEMMITVETGEIGADLLRPVSFYRLWMAREAGKSLAHLLLRGLPILAFYVVYFGITTPQSAGQWLAFGTALLLGWGLGFAWNFLVNLSAFWTQNGRGILRLSITLVLLLSGFLMPLRFFPDWFQRLCYLTPFPHMVTTVSEIYLGVLPPEGVARALWLQALWIALLFLAGQLALRAGVRKLVIQGG